MRKVLLYVYLFANIIFEQQNYIECTAEVQNVGLCHAVEEVITNPKRSDGFRSLQNYR